MDHGWSPKVDMTYINKGWKPFMTLYIFMLHDHKMQRIYTFYTKTWAFNPKNDPRGPCPNRLPTQIWWLIPKTLCWCGDLVVKTSQLHLNYCKFSGTLCRHLLKLLYQLLHCWSCAIFFDFMLCCLQASQISQFDLQYCLFLLCLIHLFLQSLCFLHLFQSLRDRDGVRHHSDLVIPLL